MLFNLSPGVLDNGSDIAHVIGSVIHSCLKCLESHKNLSLHLDTLLVVILIPDFRVLIKVVYLFIEVSTREFLAILLGVIGRLMSLADIEVRLSCILIAHLFGRQVSGACSKSASGKSDSKLHNFIFKYMTLTIIFGFYMQDF